MKKYITLILLHFFVLHSQGQLSLDPMIGYGYDITNKANKLNTVNLGLRIGLSAAPNDDKAYIQLDMDLPLFVTVTDSAYTLNQSAPPLILSEKKSGLTAYKLSFAGRKKLTGNEVRKLFGFFKTGILYQKINFKYDAPQEYIILNPEIPTDYFGVFIGGGIEYEFARNFFTQLQITSPPATKRKENFNQYAPAAYISVHFGYSIALRKK